MKFVASNQQNFLITQIERLIFLHKRFIWSEKRKLSSVITPKNLVWDISGRFSLIFQMIGMKLFFHVRENGEKAFADIERKFIGTKPVINFL